MRIATRGWVALVALATMTAWPAGPILGQVSTEAVVAESEPNNSPATADSILMGDVATGAIATETDVDVFRFQATAGMHIFAQVQLFELPDSTLELIGPNGTTVLKFDDNIDVANLGSQLSYLIPASGTYYLRVTGEISSYALRLQFSSNSQFQLESEPNGLPDSADPMTLGQPLLGTVVPGPDSDYYAVSLPAGRFYGYVQTDGSTLGNDASGESADLDLLTPGGFSVEYDDDAGPGLSPLIAGASTGGGVFLLNVRDPLQTVGVNPYIVHTAVFSSTVAETEINNTPATADAGLGLTSGTILAPGDKDYVQFSATLGDNVFIALDNDPEGDAASDPLNSRITLYAPDGTTALVVADASGDGPDGDEVIVFSPSISGTYFVSVEDVNGAGGPTYTYNLGVRVTDGEQVTSAETIGLYVPATSIWQLRNSNTPGPADLQFVYGPAGAGWRPVTGDWNLDGVDTVGLYNGAASVFHLRNANSGGVAELQFQYGPAASGWTPLAGDWDGDGDDTVGLYDPNTGLFFLRNTNSAGTANLQFQYGPAGMGWIPIVGDWDGDGDDTVGLYAPSTSLFYLRNSNSGGNADLQFPYGPAGAGWVPVAGDFDGDGIHTIGLFDPVNSIFYLRNSNSPGNADLQIQYGVGGIPLIGDWDGL